MNQWARSVVAGAAVAAVAGLGAQERGTYPGARTGGNYMHNYYLPPAPSSTPWAPAWSPDGASIAVAMSGSIWTVDPTSGVAREITYDQRYHSMPSWSPDGNWIIYTADDGGTTIQLAIVNVRTGESRALTNDSFLYADPVFSPDGTRVAYVSTRPNGFFNVYVRPIRNGQWAGDEIAISRDNAYRNSRLYFGVEDLHITPSWTRDGRELLLVSNRGVPLGSGHIWRVPAVAGGMDDAQTVVAEQTLYRARPDVSIDNRRFVYSSTRGAADQFSNLYVQPVAGGEPYKLTFFEHDAFHPRWSPDGERIAYIDNREGLPQLALLDVYGGGNRLVRIVDRRWKRPMGLLSVRTVDEAGRLTGARIHLTAADGKFYAPDDAYARVGSAGDRVFHSTGAFRVEVPAGKTRLSIVKGFEVWPATAEVDVAAGEVAAAEVVLERMTDLSARGWHGGSTHVHMNYGGNLHNTLENLMMMSAAEDQDIVLEQVANKDNRILDHQFFVPGGGPHPLSRPDMLLVVGQEYRPPFWGHVFMFGMRDHLLSPFTTGYEGTAIESLYPTNTDMFRKAKAQGASVGYVHAFAGERDPLEGDLGGAKGAIVDAALGTTDAIEWSAAGRAGFFPLYALWNNGLKVTAVGGEDSISNLHMSKLVGSHRTYVFTGGRGLDMEAWLAGMRAGRAFVTNGPLVELTVNGSLPGETVALGAGGGAVTVQARVRSIVPLEKVTLYFNGQPVEDIALAEDRKGATWEKTLQASGSGWYHLRAEGAPGDRFPLDTAYPQAFTNPVWVIVGDRPVRDRVSADYALRWIDKLQKMAEAWPGWRSQKEKDHVYAQLDEARAVYRRLAGEAGAGRAQAQTPAYDLVVANGRVIDPESGLDAVRNIGITGGTIAAISSEPMNGRRVIDAAGLVVSPGFIDLHSHGQTPETYRYQALDGVTTALELEVGTGDVDRWYAERSGGAPINFGVSIGHIPVRIAALRDPGRVFPTADGAHRAATPAEITDITRRIAEGLKQGAVSIGAGFAYTPAAAREELVEVFRLAAAERVPIHAHVRRGAPGVEEALALAAETKAPLHIVHINSTGVAATREVLQMIGDARARGVDVTTEAYPYTAGMTEIQSANLDEYAGAPADRVAQLEWPRTGERLTPETFAAYRKAGGPVVLHSNTEEMVRLAVESPLTIIASDAYWENGTGHPRTTGTFSRVLGRYVRDNRGLPLIDALRKMTVMPARRLEGRVAAMRNKGRLRAGADADITIFDAARVIDRSTYREPGLPPAGIVHVIVAGVPVVTGGTLVGATPGRPIRAN